MALSALTARAAAPAQLPLCLTARPTTRGRSGPRRLIQSQNSLDPASKLLGEDFGARDPYAAELESNFTDKVLGNADTEHRIFIGKLSHIFKNRMADMEISSEYNQAVDDAEIEDLIKKVSVGLSWTVERGDGKVVLKREWACSSDETAMELKIVVEKILSEKITGVDGADRWLQISVDGPKVYAEISNEDSGSLLFNHIIMAAKIEDIPVRHLVRKQRTFWA